VNVLAIVAHADDESLFCGGTLAKHAASGDHVAVWALSDGVSSRGGDSGMAALERMTQFFQASAQLRVSTDWSCVFADQQADRLPQLRINKAVEGRIAMHEPDVIYTHHVGDLNLDHRRVAEAVLVATRMHPARILCMTPEFPSRCVGPAFVPTHGVDITETLEQKIAACLCYTDEIRPYPHPRSEQALRAQTVERFMEIR
jgi:LmbE family N-acetylglucosaminyl deacetylase